MHRFLLGVAFVVACAAVVGGQAATIQQQLDEGERLLRERHFDKAREIFERTLAAARAEALDRFEAQSLAGLSEAAFHAAQYPTARRHGLPAVEIYERLGDREGEGRVDLILATTAELSGDLTDARARAQRAIAAFESSGDPRGRSMATLELLRVWKRPESVERRRLFERAIDDARRSGDRDLEGRALNQLGDDLFTIEEYESALSALERAAALLASTGNDNDLGTVFNSLGRVYRAHGQIRTALSYQLKALELHQKEGDTFNKIQSLNAVGAVYDMLGDVVKSREYTEQAVALAEQSGSPRVQDFLRANLANILIEEGQFARGAGLLEGVIARGIDTNVNARFALLSYALRKLGRMDDAARAAETAVERCSGAAGVADCPQALQRRAEIRLARGDAASALIDLQAALDMIEESRRKLIPSDFFKQRYAGDRNAIYGLVIRLQLQQGQDREALQTAELARSRSFIDLLASRDVRLKDKDQPYVAELRAADVAPSSTSAAIDPLAQLALTLRGPAPAPAAAASILPPAPVELRSFVTATPASASDLAAVAKRLHSTLISYWVAQDEVFVWVVAPSGRVRTARVDVLESKLRMLIRATVPFDDTAPAAASARGVLTGVGSEVAVQGVRPNAWRQLYDLLIRPVRGALPTAPGALLTIVPHGPLAGVAFAALQNEHGRYLIEDYSLHYAPAGAVLQYTADKRHADARAGSFLIVADPSLSSSRQLEGTLPPLPGALDEARAIARQVPAARRTVLTGRDATKIRVATAVERKAVLHFATHAIVRDDDPFESFLAFAPGGAADDGSLTARDVYRLDLNADLVVLSACRSGGGRVSGDGIATFARAFIYAGSPSVIASLWDVPDQSTSALFATFYRSWLAGNSKSRALRTAQLMLLGDLRAGRLTIRTPAGTVVVPEHPIFWAGFSLIGEPGQ